MTLNPYHRTAIAALLLFADTTLAAEDPVTAPDTSSERSSDSSSSGSFASDDGRLDGDHLKLRVNVIGFESLNDNSAKRCAPKGSKVKVTKQDDEHVFVIFKRIPTNADAKEKTGAMASGEAATKAALVACDMNNFVNDYTQYRIRTETLNDHAFRRTGVMFGALVVPFKFYLGSDKKLSASSTIAPYVGFRGPAPFGLTFTPVVSAGLGLVPVADAATSETETKSAFSTAIGVLLTHSKNEKFNAGLLFGKDFLSESDRAGDKSVDSVWFSLYAGYSL